MLLVFLCFSVLRLTLLFIFYSCVLCFTFLYSKQILKVRQCLIILCSTVHCTCSLLYDMQQRHCGCIHLEWMHALASLHSTPGFNVLRWDFGQISPLQNSSNSDYFVSFCYLWEREREKIEGLSEYCLATPSSMGTHALELRVCLDPKTFHEKLQ
jgi:hypothetical protein